ncbi:GDP-Man:Man(3)GlcNAc(2)-PP-Dol alpha-1,2-mannosyltransferase [Hypsibius exemplaris]|uniref:GDP-Man:Man(3)GlcNAc(2)-PP-Dol alpha-1,2-mannosyltransferase n=1 Tax=Hypsibius exemplaris TaxID=2072580 RepID=A0A1W0WV72_HYPEX|nr:GDP-Man:Man(3)GlcNAc(2)-PP-Dol alpha-1,2-mannosyltransferase [Hypsibius exemplaris]
MSAKLFKPIMKYAAKTFGIGFFVAVVTVLILAGLAFWISKKARRQKKNRDRKIVGLFHPYCLGGGGGERVLWAAVNSLGRRYPEYKYVIYTGDDPQKCLSFRTHVLDRFNIEIADDITVEFVHLSLRPFLEAHRYPVLTMMGQSLGSIVVGLEALRKLCPDVFIDTTGHAFTFPLFRILGGCRTAAYVHYPTISTDMLSRVRDRTCAHNNAGFVSRSRVLSSLKIYYYKLFACLYGLAGHCCDVTMVNSSWTFNHIKQIWKCPTAEIVYPPCNVTNFLAVPLQPDAAKREMSIVSIGQFRPEKDHTLQLRVLAEFLRVCPDTVRERVKLHFVGSCRNAGDEARVVALRRTVEELQLSQHVVFHLNAPFSELLKVCEDGTIGIHSMWNEHFGIGVVECMAAGLITVAHDSGGPKADIVVDWKAGRTGYLGSTPETYVKALLDIVNLTDADRSALRKRARDSVCRFTDEVFNREFGAALEPLLRPRRRA